MLELSIGGFFDSPDDVKAFAIALERHGVDGIFSGDSQCLAIDPFVALTVAAGATERLRLATGVTNPYTRHPAVIAGAAATLQAVSRGRFTLGIGRGDSALAYVGAAPVPPDLLEAALVQVQAYLRGNGAPIRPPGPGVRPVQQLGSIGHAPEESRLRWLSNDLPKVEVDVVATGPRVIAIAARHAERITFAVGADEARLRWAIELARASRAAAGLDPSSLQLGAMLSIAPHPDIDVGRRLVAGAVASSSRFSIMHGAPVGAIDEETRAVLEAVGRSYDMDRHGAPVDDLGVLTPEFIDRFAIVGDVDDCIGRLHRLADLGLTRFMTGRRAGGDRDREAGELCQRLMLEELAPGLKDADRPRAAGNGSEPLSPPPPPT